MNRKEKEKGRNVIEALNLLPEEKREFILGYAEGVITMSKRLHTPRENAEVGQRAG